MHQGELFESSDRGGAVQRFALPDAELYLIPQLLAPAEAAAAFATLRADVDYEQEVVVMYGREIRAPRLTAWYGDPGAAYLYSGVEHEPAPWTTALADLRRRVEAATGRAFNAVLVNFYRNGMDSVSWHSDDETDLIPDACIASLSLGAQRTFQLKHKTRDDLGRVDIDLPSGSLLVMGGACQRCWRHQLPKRRTLREGRINLTFRQVRTKGQPQG